MFQIQDRPESDGYFDFDNEEPDVEKSSGWDDDLTKYNSDKAASHKLIRIVNKKIFLSSVIFSKNINFIVKYSPSGWNHSASCPFKDHRDTTPSFSYNSIEDRFNCFGCKRSGRIVEFLAFLEEKEPVDVAKELLKTISYNDEEAILIIDEDNIKNKELLLKFAVEVNNILKINPEKLKQVEKITKIIDLYLNQNVLSKTVVYEEISGYLKSLTRRLKEDL